MKQHRIFLFVVFFLLLGFQSRSQHLLQLHFDHFVGQQQLRLSDTVYSNSFGEPFTVLQFKYYISNIVLSEDNGEEELIGKGPYLIDAADTTSTLLHLPATKLSHPNRIRFTIGVDSITNTSGVQTGDLDPMLGMFWTWNTGYIYTRLEGQSDSAHAPAHRFTWDVGGYRTPFNASRTVSLEVRSKERIGVKVDVLRIYGGSHPLPIAKFPVCHEPGKLAMQIADNTSTSFTAEP